jgi:perosamine synthetase
MAVVEGEMIPLAVPNLTGNEQEYVADAVARGYIGPDGKYVERFEGMVTKASKRRWAIAVDSGTSALMVAIYATHLDNIDIPRDAFPAVKNICRVLGLNFAVHNLPARNHDYESYREDWPGVADCAPAIGVADTLATLECYSFAANKTVTCGKGGAICGDDMMLEHRIRELIHPGYNRSGLFNVRMADVNAAIGFAQMERLYEFIEIKQGIWNRYRDAGLRMVERGESRWMSTIAQENVELFAGDLFEVRKEVFTEYDGIACYSLPCSTGLTLAEQDTVIKALTG